MITKTLLILLAAIQTCYGDEATLCSNGPNLQFTTSSSVIVPGVTPTLTLGCSFTYSPACRLTGRDMLVVYKNRRPYAANSGKSPTTMTLNWSRLRHPDIEVTGELKDLSTYDKNYFLSGKTGFLNITWTYPTKTVADTYQCHFGGDDWHNIDYNIDKTATLTKTIVIDRMVSANEISEIVQNISTLFKASNEHEQKLDSALTEIAKNKKLFEAESMAVGKLESFVTNCMTPRSAFMASTDDYVVPWKPHTQDNFFPSHIVYEKTVFDMDNSFDNKTGTFTCKQPGMWRFTVNTVSRSWLVVQIRVNDKAISTTSSSPKSDGNDRGAALSALVHLDIGDIARVHNLYSTRGLYGNRHYVHGNAFTGELVQSDKCLVE